jgi:hypothetical protein
MTAIDGTDLVIDGHDHRTCNRGDGNDTLRKCCAELAARNAQMTA